MTLKLIRQKEIIDTTPGSFYLDSVFICKSLELPWVNNSPNISCIPKGLYNIAFTFSPRFGKITLQIFNVPNRNGIRIHSANVISELRGCIAPCTKLEISNNQLFGLQSKKALHMLEDLVRSNLIVQLEII